MPTKSNIDAYFLSEAESTLAQLKAMPSGADFTEAIESIEHSIANIKRERILPVPTTIPKVNRKGVHGTVAYRQWNIWRRGVLLNSINHGEEWEEIMTADYKPTPDNKTGLYCYELSPDGLKHLPFARFNNNVGEQFILGFIEVRGQLVKHNDGIMRSEWARILHFILPTGLANTSGLYTSLIESFPRIGISVLNQQQIQDFLFQEMVFEWIRDHAEEAYMLSKDYLL